MTEYPGDGYRMSNYGAKILSPEEVVGGWKEYCKREARNHRNHIAVRGDGSESFPGVLKIPEEQLKNPGSFYNDAGHQHEVLTCFDRMFHIDYDYNCKIHRDDRQHSVGLDILSEEEKRSVPVRSSTEYGRLLNQPLESSSRKYSRVDKVMKGFYRTRGTGIPSSTN